ncbi:ABC transporter ATP-binding protein [Georgenia thermotolerans]|uniref:Spermidine/putrescine import ATP-binding protein PotA n=1 Tax=Georgenia thermotolerans TaxID=527326 RepID=A0A7J5UUK1_9MICO|nr:ABC transporter ATP-binding protein [Georgenia thermotolerans]KAE8765971.1 polyamine ABC transporter ATP-binding protein [Georgenia thermotolerans]
MIVLDSGTSTRTAVRPLLQVSEVSRAYGDVKALDDVSLSIGENEFFALLGPSGCGKTTLLRSIAGFEQPDAGGILLGGEDLLAMPPHRRPVNLMFQSYALFPHMSVAKNVAYGLEREKLPRAEIDRRVGEVLETVGLSAMGGRRPAQLSGGQRQRVALARAIVKRPKVLLLDEPLSALDRKVRGEMQLELKRLQHEVGITFVIVTHDQEEALSMADRIAVMAAGRLQQVADPVELYRNPRNLFVADFIGSSTLVAGAAGAGTFTAEDLGALPGTVPPDLTGPAHLVLRPEWVRLTEPDHGLLRGTVRDVQFHGGGSTIAVAVAGLPTPLLVGVPGATTTERGAAVGVAWDAADAVVVQDELA